MSEYSRRYDGGVAQTVRKEFQRRAEQVIIDFQTIIFDKFEKSQTFDDFVAVSEMFLEAKCVASAFSAAERAFELGTTEKFKYLRLCACFMKCEKQTQAVSAIEKAIKLLDCCNLHDTFNFLKDLVRRKLNNLSQKDYFKALIEKIKQTDPKKFEIYILLHPKCINLLEMFGLHVKRFECLARVVGSSKISSEAQFETSFLELKLIHFNLQLEKKGLLKKNIIEKQKEKEKEKNSAFERQCKRVVFEKTSNFDQFFTLAKFFCEIEQKTFCKLCFRTAHSIGATFQHYVHLYFFQIQKMKKILNEKTAKIAFSKFALNAVRYTDNLRDFLFLISIAFKFNSLDIIRTLFEDALHIPDKYSINWIKLFDFAKKTNMNAFSLKFAAKAIENDKIPHIKLYSIFQAFLSEQRVVEAEQCAIKALLAKDNNFFTSMKYCRILAKHKLLKSSRFAAQQAFQSKDSKFLDEKTLSDCVSFLMKCRFQKEITACTELILFQATNHPNVASSKSDYQSIEAFERDVPLHYYEPPTETPGSHSHIKVRRKFSSGNRWVDLFVTMDKAQQFAKAELCGKKALEIRNSNADEDNNLTFLLNFFRLSSRLKYFSVAKMCADVIVQEISVKVDELSSQEWNSQQFEKLCAFDDYLAQVKRNGFESIASKLARKIASTIIKDENFLRAFAERMHKIGLRDVMLFCLKQASIERKSKLQTSHSSVQTPFSATLTPQTPFSSNSSNSNSCVSTPTTNYDSAFCLKTNSYFPTFYEETDRRLPKNCVLKSSVEKEIDFLNLISMLHQSHAFKSTRTTKKICQRIVKILKKENDFVHCYGCCVLFHNLEMQEMAEKCYLLAAGLARNGLEKMIVLANLHQKCVFSAFPYIVRDFFVNRFDFEKLDIIKTISKFRNVADFERKVKYYEFRDYLRHSTSQNKLNTNISNESIKLENDEKIRKFSRIPNQICKTKLQKKRGFAFGRKLLQYFDSKHSFSWNTTNLSNPHSKISKNYLLITQNSFLKLLKSLMTLDCTYINGIDNFKNQNQQSESEFSINGEIIDVRDVIIEIMTKKLLSPDVLDIMNLPKLICGMYSRNNEKNADINPSFPSSQCMPAIDALFEKVVIKESPLWNSLQLLGYFVEKDLHPSFFKIWLRKIDKLISNQADRLLATKKLMVLGFEKEARYYADKSYNSAVDVEVHIKFLAGKILPGYSSKQNWVSELQEFCEASKVLLQRSWSDAAGPTIRRRYANFDPFAEISKIECGIGLTLALEAQACVHADGKVKMGHYLMTHKRDVSGTEYADQSIAAQVENMMECVPEDGSSGEEIVIAAMKMVQKPQMMTLLGIIQCDLYKIRFEGSLKRLNNMKQFVNSNHFIDMKIYFNDGIVKKRETVFEFK